MKAILGIIMFAIATISVRAQEPAKFDNTIKVSGVGFGQVKAALLDSGYFIHDQNAEDGTIVTESRNVDENRGIGGIRTERFHLIMYIRVKDSVATFKGKYSNGAFGEQHPPFEDLDYWKAKTSVPHLVFHWMDKIAKSFGKPVAYSKS